VTSAWCIAAAFGAYFCAYAFRKPFAVCPFDGIVLWGVDYKTVLVTSQVAGYTFSKFLGIKVVAEIPPQRRIAGLVALVAFAEAALLAFAVVPQPYNFVCLFFNGLPLGMVFGMVLAYLEGRRVTELLTAGLCASFILADGAAKSLGALLLAYHVPEAWLPCFAGAIALAPMAGFTWMLAQIPPPSTEDVVQRAARAPMDGRQRWDFFRRYAPGLAGLLLMYTCITVLRSIRSDYAAEIWRGLRGGESATPPQIYSTSEIVVALTVMLANGLCFLIKDNRKAFFVGLSLSALGTLLVIGSVVGLRAGLLGGFAFMVLCGVGLYLPYVAVHTTIFERLLAITPDRGNLGYLMYLADALGYLGYPLYMITCRLALGRSDLLRLFVASSAGMAVVSLACVVLTAVYFRKMPARTSAAGTPSAAEVPPAGVRTCAVAAETGSA
jgi:hypothetical protein